MSFGGFNIFNIAFNAAKKKAAAEAAAAAAAAAKKEYDANFTKTPAEATFRNARQAVTFRSIPPAGDERFVAFPAYLTSFSDSYGGQWNEYMDMGRGDPKFMYSQYSRNLSFSFYCVSRRESERTVWLEAINTLTEMTKPKYVNDIGFNGVFCELTIAGLIDQIKGFVESVDISIDTETPWSSLGGMQDALPIVFNVDVAFRVIGDKKPNYHSDPADGGLGSKKYDPGLQGMSIITPEQAAPIPTLKTGPIKTPKPNIKMPGPTFRG